MCGWHLRAPEGGVEARASADMHRQNQAFSSQMLDQILHFIHRFYHVKIGTKRKHQIEEKLQSDAVGMSDIQGHDITSSLEVVVFSQEPENRGEDEVAALEIQGIEVTHGREVVDVCDGAARLASNHDEVIEVPHNHGHKTGQSAHSCNSLEARYLSKYSSWCQATPSVGQHIFPDNTTYRHLPNA
ncbi:hypothetical protein CY34DRAFT_109475 [Suillus luteus UH-Slu-Lm8-n1]|uniref:Uncharacterized protein n=1 Tax=Suillus luteus UH-Slu-Lm8-n1 TaxID=930992 RepID=A0A0C9ZGP6_9AGAM|nr:hypothetical protein CY34DRAFT_109475 [Suillus luteus UH-Slu-Lm8-n1]